MGWDAHTNLEICWGNNPRIKNKNIRSAFTKEDNFIKEKAGSVDMDFMIGGLDCSDCRKMLEKATGRDCYNYEGWKPNEIEAISQNANWNFEYKKKDAWAYWSAKKFLELCAKFKLHVTFSW